MKDINDTLIKIQMDKVVGEKVQNALTTIIREFNEENDDIKLEHIVISNLTYQCREEKGDINDKV
jgi:ABC-type glycerol-3-phosphate transport system substrate-binding protein